MKQPLEPPKPDHIPEDEWITEMAITQKELRIIKRLSFWQVEAARNLMTTLRKACDNDEEFDRISKSLARDFEYYGL